MRVSTTNSFFNKRNGKQNSKYSMRKLFITTVNVINDSEQWQQHSIAFEMESKVKFIIQLASSGLHPGWTPANSILSRDMGQQYVGDLQPGHIGWLQPIWFHGYPKVFWRRCLFCENWKKKRKKCDVFQTTISLLPTPPVNSVHVLIVNRAGIIINKLEMLQIESRQQYIIL